MSEVRDTSTSVTPPGPNNQGGNPVAEAIRSRRTIHNFRPDSPPPDLIRRAIDLARWAPNHKLTEPWRFRILGRKTAEALAHLNADVITEKKGARAGQDKLRRWLEVPGWMAVTCVRSADPFRAHEDYAACACAVQNLTLYLWSEGIGVKWTTGDVTRDPRFFYLLGIDPAAEDFVGLLWYGYPVEIPPMQRKPVEQILLELP